MTFGFHGIWQGTAVLYDKQTKSLWLHLTGECIDGELRGRRLRPVSGRHVQWGEWRREYPQTDVMDEDLQFRDRYFSESSARRGLDMFPASFPSTIQTRDDRLPLSALCLGIKVDDVTKAYPFSELRKAPDGVVNDSVGDVPVVVWLNRQGSAVALGRQLGDTVLTLRAHGEDGLMEPATGSLFSPGGRGLSGPRKDRQLPQLWVLQAEWYGWYAVYPQTHLWSHQPDP